MTADKTPSWIDRNRVEQQALAIRLAATRPDLTPAQADLVFGYAWREGHSSGEQDVALIFDNIADLIVAACAA